MYKKVINLHDHFLLNIYLFGKEQQRHEAHPHGVSNKNMIKKTKVKEVINKIIRFNL